jgi:hypothetical protein
MTKYITIEEIEEGSRRHLEQFPETPIETAKKNKKIKCQISRIARQNDMTPEQLFDKLGEIAGEHLKS